MINLKRWLWFLLNLEITIAIIFKKQTTIVNDDEQVNANLSIPFHRTSIILHELFVVS